MPRAAGFGEKDSLGLRTSCFWCSLCKTNIQEEVTIIVIILLISIPELLILIIKIMSLGRTARMHCFGSKKSWE